MSSESATCQWSLTSGGVVLACVVVVVVEVAERSADARAG